MNQQNGLSRVVNCIRRRFNIICNWMKYFTAWEQRPSIHSVKYIVQLTIHAVGHPQPPICLISTTFFFQCIHLQPSGKKSTTNYAILQQSTRDLQLNDFVKSCNFLWKILTIFYNKLKPSTTKKDLVVICCRNYKFLWYITIFYNSIGL